MMCIGDDHNDDVLVITMMMINIRESTNPRKKM